MTQQGKKATWRSLVALEAATLGAGALVGFLTRDGMDFFHALNKPGFAPPGLALPHRLEHPLCVDGVLHVARPARTKGATVSCCWGCISPS